MNTITLPVILPRSRHIYHSKENKEEGLGGMGLRLREKCTNERKAGGGSTATYKTLRDSGMYGSVMFVM